MRTAIAVRHLKKTFGKLTALNSVNLEIQEGEMVALIGASGSGKSTLLRHLAGLVTADRDGGEVEMLGQTVQKNGCLARDVRSQRGSIGFVFQQFNLVGRLSVLGNVLTGSLSRVPLYRSLIGKFSKSEKINALKALNRVGIAKWANCRATDLSGGQQQRAAIARSIVQRARIILADEPIASLDPESSRRVMEILKDLNRTDKTTVVVSLHQVDFALQFCPRVVALAGGTVLYDGPSENVDRKLLQNLYSGDPELETLNLARQPNSLEIAELPREAA